MRLKRSSPPQPRTTRLLNCSHGKLDELRIVGGIFVEEVWNATEGARDGVRMLVRVGAGSARSWRFIRGCLAPLIYV
jgi:hypothetical protein